MSVKVIDKDRGMKKFLEGFKKLEGLEGRVGIQGPQASAQHDEESGLTTAAVGAIHEFGAPQVGIPQRSFLRGTFDRRRFEVVAALKKQMRLAAKQGATDNAEMAYKSAILVAAETLRTAVIDTIDSGIFFQALKPETIERKHGETTPLIATGVLKGSITAVVVKK